LSIPAKYPPLPLSPEQQRRRLLATLVEWALGAARAQPTVITTEDLHWADPSTLELQLLVEQGATARLLLLYTARPEFRVPWPMRAHHTQITLNRLSARNARAMVGQVAAQKALTEDTVAAVIERNWRGAALRRGTDTSGTGEWRCKAHRAPDPGDVARFPDGAA
jgi:predicted ATPase